MNRDYGPIDRQVWSRSTLLKNVLLTKRSFVFSKVADNKEDPLRFVQYKGNLSEGFNKKLLGGCHAYTITLSRYIRMHFELHFKHLIVLT